MRGHDKITPEGKRLLEQLRELSKLQVRVGYQRGENTDEDSGADIADIAMWNELGTVNMPSRPFMRDSVDNHAGEIQAFCEAQLRAIAGGGQTAQGALNAIGSMQKGLVQNEIREGNFAPNSDITINGGWMRTPGGKPFYVKGKGSNKPLIDTGRMRQSVNYVIREKGGD
jgi:hypothetical protein